jgi:hypothetical protein
MMICRCRSSDRLSHGAANASADIAVFPSGEAPEMRYEFESKMRSTDGSAAYVQDYIKSEDIVRSTFHDFPNLDFAP